MNSAPLISVIIPVYNVGDFLIPCLESVAAQTYPNLEVLLIDDGSTDDSGARCDAYAARDARFKVVHKENGGVSSARNLGLELAQGEFIAFVDSDDRIEKDYFETLYGDLVRSGAEIVFCGFRVIDHCGNPVAWEPRVKECRLIKEKEALMRDIVAQDEGYYAAVWGALIPKSLTANVRFQPLRYGEDGLFMFDVLSSGPVVYLDAYKGYIYIRQPNSVTMHVKNPLGREIDLLKLNAHKYQHFPKKWKEMRQILFGNYVQSIHEVAYMTAQRNNPAEKREVAVLLKEHMKNILPHLNTLPGKPRVRMILYSKAPWLYNFLARLNQTIRG